MSRTRLTRYHHTNCCGAGILSPVIEKTQVRKVYNSRLNNGWGGTEEKEVTRFEPPETDEELLTIFSNSYQVRPDNYVTFLWVPAEFCALVAERSKRSKYLKLVGRSSTGECWLYGKESAYGA